LYIVIQEEEQEQEEQEKGTEGGAGGRGGVTLGRRPEHSFYSWVVTEMMGWPVTRSGVMKLRRPTLLNTGGSGDLAGPSCDS